MTSPWRSNMRPNTPKARREWYAAMRACPTCAAAKARRDYCPKHGNWLEEIEAAETAKVVAP